jgi:hypothetical protein
LSRAYLGKTIDFSYKWIETKGVSSPHLQQQATRLASGGGTKRHHYDHSNDYNDQTQHPTSTQHNASRPRLLINRVVMYILLSIINDE